MNSATSDENADDDTSDTSFDTDDEIDDKQISPALEPCIGQQSNQNEPQLFDFSENWSKQSSLPLCILTNARSVYNKQMSLREILRQICPSLILISETWERENEKLDIVIKNTPYNYLSFYRKNRSPGGGCAIFVNEKQFHMNTPDIIVPAEVEAVWAIITQKTPQNHRVKRIAVGSIYVSPRSRHKDQTIEHIIQTIHILRAQFDNDINFLVGGDFNKLNITEVLDCHGGLNQVISLPTRKSATLDILLTDLHTLYHPPHHTSPSGGG